MQLHEALSAVNKFREDYPEKIILLGSDFEFTTERLPDLVYLSEQYYLSENITQEKAMEKAITYFVKRATNELTEHRK